jgi:hypothetical protein
MLSSSKLSHVCSCRWQSLCRGTLAYLGGEIGLAFLFMQRFTCEEVDAERAEVRGAARLGRAGKDIRTPRDLEVDKAGGHDRGLKLRLQQSTSNSASPEINLALGAFRHSLLDEDITDL